MLLPGLPPQLQNLTLYHLTDFRSCQVGGSGVEYLSMNEIVKLLHCPQAAIRCGESINC